MPAGSLARDAWQAMTAEPLIPLLLLTVAAAVFRISLLDMPMRLDEATTFNEFVLQPWRVTIGKYQATNNHPLHSVLAKLAVDLFGRDPWAVRLPALVAGVLLVPATYFAASRGVARGASRAAAWFAAIGVAVLPTLVYFSANARGYSMVALFAVLQWLALRDALHTGRRFSWLLVAALGTLGVYTHLTMVFAYAGNLVWALDWTRRQRAPWRAVLWPMVWSGVLSVAAAVVLYLPFVYISGLDAFTGSRNMAARSTESFLGGLPILAQRIGESWATAMPLAIALAAGAWVLVALVTSAREDADGSIALLATLAFVASVFLTFRLPPPRSTVYLLPFILIALGRSARALASRVGGGGGRAVWGVAAVPFAAVTVAHLTSQPVRTMRETGWMPEGEAIYERLQTMIAPGDAIASFWLPRDILRYYWLRDGKGAAPLAPQRCPVAPSTLFLLVREGETVELVLRYQRLPVEVAATATKIDQFGRYALWRLPAPADLKCPERLSGPLVPEGGEAQ